MTTLTLASTSTLNPYSRIGRNPRNPTPLQTSVFSRPLSQAGLGTGTSGSASFHSFEQESESESGPTDKTTLHYKPEPNTETQLPIQELEPEPEPVTIMAPGDKMDIDHEGKSYLKKPEPFDGN